MEDRVEVVVVYRGGEAAVEGVKAAAKKRVVEGLKLRSSDVEGAKRKFLEAGGMGLEVFDRRMTYEQVVGALAILSESATALGNLEESAGNVKEAEKWREYVAQLRQVDEQRVRPIVKGIRAVDQKLIDQHAGDVFVFAERARERVWRVEAVMQLGRLRFNAPTAGDQQEAARVLERLTNDADPAVREAAKRARALTVEEYRMQ